MRIALFFGVLIAFPGAEAMARASPCQGTSCLQYPVQCPGPTCVVPPPAQPDVPDQVLARQAAIIAQENGLPVPAGGSATPGTCAASSARARSQGRHDIAAAVDYACRAVSVPN